MSRLGLQDGIIEDDNILVLQQGSGHHHAISTSIRQNFLLSDINSASITLAPVDSPLTGWSTYVIFSRDDDPFQLTCMTIYDQYTPSFYCTIGEDGSPDQIYRSEEIPIDVEQPHQVRIEVDNETYLLHVFLDGDNVFDVDTQKPRTFFEDNTFSFLFLIFNQGPSTQDFKMSVDDIQAGVIEN